MSVQLPFLAGWALQLSSRREPLSKLAAIERAKRDARAEIRLVLDRHAERFGIKPKEVTAAITGYADDMLNDLFYETKSRLEAESEKQDPV
jgi:hypothetical protein